MRLVLKRSSKECLFQAAKLFDLPLVLRLCSPAPSVLLVPLMPQIDTMNSYLEAAVPLLLVLIALEKMRLESTMLLDTNVLRYIIFPFIFLHAPYPC